MNNRVLATAALFACTLYSQSPPVGRAAIETPVNALRSPEVNAERTVTLRFRAPAATAVDIVGEVTMGKGPQPMARGADGVWTATVGPLAPEIWSYNFRVQGIDIPDPSNPAIKPVPPGPSIVSFAEVPGDGPAFYDARHVPHGEVRIVTYESKAMGVTRLLWIYTPPGYAKSRLRYPVLYLLHGNGEAQDGWVMDGRANFIVDNLIADGKARPMLIVMPLVEKNCRVAADAEHRAIAGLSMGGGQALAILLAHPGVFHYVLGYSAAISAQFMDADSVFRDALANPARLNKTLHLLWLSCGRQDFLCQANRQFAESLHAKAIRVTVRETEGAHVWSVWRNNLNESAALLFK